MSESNNEIYERKYMNNFILIVFLLWAYDSAYDTDFGNVTLI